MKDDWREIVGVVANEYDDGVNQKPPATVYFPLMMTKFWGDDAFIYRDPAFVIRSTRTGSGQLLEDVRRQVWAVAPQSPLNAVKTMDEIYRNSMARTSFTLVMLGISSGMALLLGLIGVYGVISYSVAQRTREIGIRVALGARATAVVAIFVRHGLTLSVIGAVCGLAGAFVAKAKIESLLFGVTPGDPMTYAAVSLGLIAAAVLASYVPSRRAASVNPMDTLRAE
jgi:ABC-type antimicrobial peptide transport system permease subunit